MGKFDDEYVEDLSVEELLSVVLYRVLENEDQSGTYKEISSIRDTLVYINKEISELKKKIDAVSIGQWIEARLQTLEKKEREMDVSLRVQENYLNLHLERIVSLEEKVF